MKAATGKEVNRSLQEFTQKDNRTAVLLLLADGLLYIIFIASIFFISGVWFKALMGPVIGLVISGLFVLGHDAAHNSLTGTTKLNKWLGRLAFLPSLHNFSMWQYAHNQVHHAFTNYKQRDNAYTPLSPREYLESNYFTKTVYALNRTAIGHATYYLFDYWFALVFFPQQKGMKKSGEHWLDFLLLSAYLLVFNGLLLGANVWVKSIGYVGMDVLSCVFWGFVWPFFWWNWWMGFAIYQHHTNIETKWFNNYEEWHYWEVQLFHSTHIRFPLVVELMANNIMKHTAHHANMNIPCYRLNKAQIALEQRFGDQIKVYDWDLVTYLRTLRNCKLYDYQSHKWVTFKQARLIDRLNQA